MRRVSNHSPWRSQGYIAAHQANSDRGVTSKTQPHRLVCARFPENPALTLPAHPGSAATPTRRGWCGCWKLRSGLTPLGAAFKIVANATNLMVARFPSSQRVWRAMNLDARELAATFDLEKLTPEFYANPYPTYRALRETDPVKRLPNGSYFLTRYDDLVAAYKNTKAFSSDKKKEFSPKYGASLLYEHHTTSLVFNDPPAHTRVRRLIMGALSPRAIAGMEPDLVRLVDRLLDAIAAKGKVDLIDDFAAAIPIEVIGNLLDVPAGRARAVARLVAGHSRRAGAGDRPGRLRPRQQGGEGFSRLSRRAGGAAAGQARQSRPRRADPAHSGRRQWRAADRKGTAAQLHLPAQCRPRDHHQFDRQRPGGAVGPCRARNSG